MAHKVVIKILEGRLKGKEMAIRLGEGLQLKAGDIVVEGHDVLLFGRAEDCRVCLPQDDGQVSRHHFVMEVNAPDVRIRDYGSLNGTHVNDKKIGARSKGQSPEEGQKQKYPTVDLRNGDRVRIGESLFTITMELDRVCQRCGQDVSDADREACGGTFEVILCSSCQRQQVANADGGGSASEMWCPEPVRCQKCGKNVEAELGKGRQGDYICEECRQKAEEDPAELLYHMLREAGLIEAGAAKPKVPGYEIGERIGKGGYGAVYLATHQQSGQRVAIKVMLAKTVVSEKARNDFLREIKATKGLRHPNVIALLNHGTAGATFYFVMEYCRLGSVGTLMRQRGGKLSLPEATPIMLEALDGLAFCHSQRLVHRDLKPDNLLLSDVDGRMVVKVSDLGLAKNFESAGLSGMTVTGQYAGTYEFMPREQLTHFKYVKPSSDVWSIGATFYHMLTGRLPYNFPRGRDPGDVILHDEVIPIRTRDSSINKELAAVIDRSLAIQVAERYPDAGEMKKAMASVLRK